MARIAPPPRRSPLSLTSLIDVIFLLLLFFMLSSTFTRLGALELIPGTPGGAPGQPPIFVQLGPDTLRANAEEVTLERLPDRLTALAGAEGQVLVALAEGVSAQRLVDVLAALRGARFGIRVLP